MGYKGVDNRDIRVDVTNKKANKQILDAYLPDPTAQAELAREFADLEKEMAKEKREATKRIRQELKDLQHEVAQNKVVEYGNSISGKISLQMMYARMDGIIQDMKNGHERATTNILDAATVLPIQIALNRAGYPVKVDGMALPGGETIAAIKVFQMTNDFEATGKLDLATMEALSAYIAPNWESKQESKKRAIEKESYKAQEEKKMEMMPGDKLQQAGDEKFAKNEYAEALNYYKMAARAYNTVINVGKDPIAADKAKEQLTALDPLVAEKFLREANRLMDEAKLTTGTKAYKEGEKQKAINLLKMAYALKAAPIDQILSEARRNDNMGNLEYKKAESAVVKAKTELARVQKSLDEANLGKPTAIDSEGTVTARGPAHPEKVPVWEKQVAFWQKELVKAEGKAKEFATVVLNPAMTGENLIVNYVNSYFGPIPEDPEPVLPPKEVATPRSQSTTIDTGNIGTQRLTERDVIGTRGNVIATVPRMEYVAPKPLEAGRDAMNFLIQHCTADVQSLINKLRDTAPNDRRLNYFVRQGDTFQSIAADVGLPEAVVRQRLGGNTPVPDQCLVLEAGEGHRGLRAYVELIALTEPYRLKFAEYPNPADYNLAVRACAAMARRKPISIQGTEYILKFVR